jgi:hypothetical protein
MKKLIFILSIFLLAGCSPQVRLANLMNRYPHLNQTTVVADTIIYIHTDTITIPGSSVDTFFLKTDTFIQITNAGDTIQIKTKGDKIKVNWRIPKKAITIRDTLRIPYMDTLWKINHIPIDSGTISKYRKQGAGILVGIFALIFFISLALKIYFKL